ncbi:MAG TPA: hypothetical protein VNQ33_03315 [Acidimicrobiales bacterium]|nr:hypothetical protein [Acidimicrobiales bacterium]
MPHPFRSLVVTGSLLVLATGAAACGSSGGSDASASTTAAKATTTSHATTTTEASTTGSSSGETPTTTGQVVDPATGEVDCDALLQEYTVVFDPDDLASSVAFFRKYEPSMPDDVAAASERLAAAYEKAGDLGHMDMGSLDLTADAQAFTDWLDNGCPAG